MTTDILTWDLEGEREAEVTAVSAIEHGHGGSFLLSDRATKDYSLTSRVLKDPFAGACCSRHSMVLEPATVFAVS